MQSFLSVARSPWFIIGRKKKIKLHESKKIYHYDKAITNHYDNNFAAQAHRQDKTGANMLYII